MLSFWEKDFGKIWPIFQNAKRIIGFNSINFDVPALQPYADFPLSKLPHFDILLMLKEAFGKRISLDAIAKETLDKEKTDSGVNAVLYWQEGGEKNLEKLRKYCEMDVKYQRKHDFVVEGYLHLKTGGTKTSGFSYPEEDPINKFDYFKAGFLYDFTRYFSSCLSSSHKTIKGIHSIQVVCFHCIQRIGKTRSLRVSSAQVFISSCAFMITHFS
jgi:DEAD/DEAH box helicase domain-containing protein